MEYFPSWLAWTQGPEYPVPTVANIDTEIVGQRPPALLFPSFTQFLKRECLPHSRFLSFSLQQLQEPAKRDTLTPMGETRPKKAPPLQQPAPLSFASKARRERGSMPTIHFSPLLKSASLPFSPIKFIGILREDTFCSS